MIGAVFRLEWRLALVRRRLLVWNLLVPALIVAPVAFSPAAAPHRAAVYAVFFVFFGVFGSAIPLIRDGRSGRTEKLLLTGYGSRRWLLERVVAGSTIDVAELLPSIALVSVAGGARPAGAAALALALALALVFANLLGALVAAAVRSLAEGALGCSVIALLSLHLAGAFRTAREGSRAAVAQTGSPFRPLVEAARAVAEAGAEPTAAAWWWPLAVALFALILAFVAAPWMGRRLGGSAF
jgi:hypothetical protein